MPGNATEAALGGEGVTLAQVTNSSLAVVDNGTRNASVVEGLKWSPGSVTWTLGNTPWIPAVVVGCGMFVFLSLSFYSHHKRVRRKREMLMDYLSALLYSGAWTRGRSVSILCNTNCIALSELGSSFKIKFDDNAKSSPAEFLREKYLKDLLDFTTARGRRKRRLKRFISAPVEHKFRRVACQFIANSNAARLRRGGIGALARNLSMPGGPFDSYDFDFPSSLAEARTSITQGVLLDPTRMRQDGVGGRVSFERAATACESCFNHSCKNADLNSAREPGQPAALKAAQPHPGAPLDGYSVQSQAPLEVSLACDQTYELLCARTRPTDTSPVFESTQHSEAESAVESSERNMHSESPLSKNDISVSVTRSSAVPLYNHAFRPTRTLQYTPKVVEIPDDRLASLNNPFQEESKAFNRCQNESTMELNINSHTCVVYAPEQSRSKYEQFFTEGTNETDVHVTRNHQLRAVCHVNTYPVSYPRYENPPDEDHDKDDDKHTPEHTVMPLELHSKSLDEHGRRKTLSPSPNSPEKQAINFTKSLDCGVTKSPRKFPVHHNINGTDYNPLFPGEIQSTFSVQNPPSFLPAAFCRQLPPLARDAGEACPSDALVRCRAPKLATQKTLSCKPTSKTSKDFRSIKSKSRGAFCKTLSTQSTRALIPDSGNPLQGFSSLDSDQFSPTPACQRFFSLNEESATSSSSNNNNNDLVTFAGQTFPRGEKEEEDRCWQMSDYPEHYPAQRACSLQTVGNVTWGDSSAFRRRGDVNKRDLDMMLPLENLSLARENRSEVRQSSNVHRLPRFQVRSGMSQHRRLLAQHCHVQGEYRHPVWHQPASSPPAI